MASILKVDTLTGVTTAGSIAITGEGNSTTTNLQQGLIKAQCRFNMQTDAVTGSFNISSVTDNGSGESINTLTNAMNDGLYTVTATCGHSDGTENTYIVAAGLRRSDNPTTTQYVIQSASALANSSAGFSASVVCSMIVGDLA